MTSAQSAKKQGFRAGSDYSLLPSRTGIEPYKHLGSPLGEPRTRARVVTRAFLYVHFAQHGKKMGNITKKQGGFYYILLSLLLTELCKAPI